MTPDPILVFIVGEETGSISLPSAGALVWQAGSETNMASVPESTRGEETGGISSTSAMVWLDGGEETGGISLPPPDTRAGQPM